MSFEMYSVPSPAYAVPGISAATEVRGGRLLFLSGHVPLKADGELVGTGFEMQLVQVFENMKATLEAAGSGMEHVARLTFFVVEYDPSMLPTLRAVRDRFVNLERPPASALIGVAALFDPSVIVEVDAIAVVPP